MKKSQDKVLKKTGCRVDGAILFSGTDSPQQHMFEEADAIGHKFFMVREGPRGRQYGSYKDVDAFLPHYMRMQKPCVYEIIREGQPASLYFDIESSTDFNLDIDQVLASLRTLLQNMDIARDTCISVLNGCRKNKHSYHLIVPHVKFACNNDPDMGMKAVAEALQDKLAFPCVDLSVYTKNRVFRLARSCKYKKPDSLLRSTTQDIEQTFVTRPINLEKDTIVTKAQVLKIASRKRKFSPDQVVNRLRQQHNAKIRELQLRIRLLEQQNSALRKRLKSISKN